MLDVFIIQKIREEEERRRERGFHRPSLEESLPRDEWPEGPEDADGRSTGKRGVVIIERDEA
jgi:hypothetical protein